MALETVVIKITGDSKDLNKTIDQLEKVGKVDRQNAASFKKTSKQMGSSFDHLEKRAMALGATMLGAFAIQQVVSYAINTLKNFEKELSTLQSITGSTAKEMEFFQQAAKDVGQATKTSATEVVKAFTMIGSAQPELLKNSKALAEVTKQSLILSKAAGIDASSAATALTSAMNQFGVSAKDAAKFTDIFATSQQKGSSFIAATSEALVNSGAAASAAGLTFETTNAAIQALAKGAIVGARAGTSLRGVLSKLSSQADDSINPSMVGLGDTITELAKRNLTLKDATKLVGEEGATGLLTLIKQKDIYFELDGALNDVGNGMEQMAINTDNLDGALDDLTNEYETFMLSLSGSTGVMSSVVKSVSNMFAGINEAAAADVSWTQKILALTDATGAQRLMMVAASKANEVGKEVLNENTKVTDKWVQSLLTMNTGLKEGSLLTDEYTDSQLLLAKTNEKHEKTIGELKKELKELREAQDNMVKGSDEYNKSQARVIEIQKILKGETKGAKTEFKLLQGVISDLKKELQDQALAGDIDPKTLADLKILTDQLTEAQKKLNEALKTDEEKAEDTAKIAADNAKIAASEASFANQKRADLEDNAKLAKDLGVDEFNLMVEFMTSEFETFKEFEEKKREEVQKTADTRIENIQNTVDLISSIEQQASAIFAQISENKLIALDNEETKALRALESQGLGEEELAEKKKAIQEDIAKQRAEILRKQFIADKAAALVQIAIDTALGIMKTIGQTGFLGTPLAVIIGTLGAAQAAIVAAQPVPEFHEGKKAELKDGEIFAKVLKSESVIPPEQSKKYKGAIDSMIDKKFENYVFQEYMLPMMKSMSKKDITPYNDVHLWNNQKKQIKLMQESNGLAKAMIKTLDNTNSRRSWK